MRSRRLLVASFLLSSAARPDGLERQSLEAQMMESTRKQLASIQIQIEAASRTRSTTSVADPQPSPAGMTRPHLDCDPLPAGELDSHIGDASRREGVPKELVRAVVAQESGGRPCAVSVKGAMGIMQLMPATATQFGVTEPFDPKQSISAGTRLLAQLLQRYKGDLRLALSAYNAGTALVDLNKDVPVVLETQQYVESVLRKLKAAEGAHANFTPADSTAQETPPH